MNKGGNAKEFRAGYIKRGGRVFTSGQSRDIRVGAAVSAVECLLHVFYPRAV
jgi:hypothetical protein